MKGKLNMVVLVSLAVLLAVFGVVGSLLFRGISRFSAAEKKANGLFRELETYYRSNPFPSEGNVDIEKANAGEMERWCGVLLDELRKGDVLAVEKSPSRFMSRLAKTRNSLLGMAARSRVALPNGFAFGFERYLAEGSELPPASLVPGLTEQLVTIDQIMAMLISNRVEAISEVVRQDIQDVKPVRAAPRVSRVRRTRAPHGGRQAAAASVGAAVTSPVSEKLYRTYRYTFTFRAKERTLMEVLNELSRYKGFLTLVDVQLRRDQADVQQDRQVEPTIVQAADSSGVPTPRKVWPSRQERMVSGPGIEQSMAVKLQVDVYRFTREADGDAD